MRLTLVALLAMPALLTAQARALRMAERVRIASPNQVTGAVIQADSNSVSVLHGASLSIVQWRDVTELKVSEKRSIAAGALHGGKWGLTIGAAFGLLFIATPQREDDELTDGELAAAAAVEGAVFGALAGAIWPGRRWRALDVAATRAATSQAAFGDVAAATPPAEQHRVVSSKSNFTPAAELSLGSSAPRSTHGQFPGFGASMAINKGFGPTRGVSLVGEAHAELFRSSVTGGARVYGRTAPLHSDSRVITWFGQLLAGSMRAERSGVVEGTGGFVWQPGAGVDYGRGDFAGRLQIDYAVVRDGYVFDDRVTTGPVEKLTGPRVWFGVTLRARGW